MPDSKKRRFHNVKHGVIIPRAEANPSRNKRDNTFTQLFRKFIETADIWIAILSQNFTWQCTPAHRHTLWCMHTACRWLQDIPPFSPGDGGFVIVYWATVLQKQRQKRKKTEIYCRLLLPAFENGEKAQHTKTISSEGWLLGEIVSSFFLMPSLI